MQGQSQNNSALVDDYRVLEQIGQGVFSIVYRAEHIRTKAIVALKEIRKDISQKDQLLVENEIDILRRCQHPNIITLLRDFKFKGRKYLVFEFCGRGDLNKLLKEQGTASDDVGTFHELTVQMIATCICSALGELHRNNTVHRDLKLANILLTDEFAVKLADFGFSKQSEEELMKTYCGTPITMAPEILDHQSYRKESCDSWSLGIICYQMLYGQPPWMPDEIGLTALSACIKQKPLRFNEHVEVTEQCKKFLRRCLDKNMKTRPTIRELMQDPWLVEGTEQLVRVTLSQKLQKNAFVHEEQLTDNFELPELVSQASLEAANSEEWAIDDIFKLTIEQAFMREIRRLQLVNPKNTIKRLEELFGDSSNLQLIVPLLWIKKIKGLSLINIALELPKKTIILETSKCKEFTKIQSAVLGGIKKLLDLERITKLDKINLEGALSLALNELLTNVLTVAQPVELIREKFDALLGLVELLQPNLKLLTVGIAVNSTLDDFEQEELLSELEQVSKEYILEKINDGTKKKQTEESLKRKFTYVFSNVVGGSEVEQHQQRIFKYIIVENYKAHNSLASS